MLFYLDTNECLQNSTCHPNATCTNIEGSYICMCETGFDGDGFTCNGKKTKMEMGSCKEIAMMNEFYHDRLLYNVFYVDTNECLQNSTCHPNATCNNTEGSYMCICDTGCNGDGFTCNGKIIQGDVKHVRRNANDAFRRSKPDI